MITVKEVREQVKRVKELVDDPERAHAEEDSIWHTVLKEISEGAENAQKLATEALKTRRIGFERYCS